MPFIYSEEMSTTSNVTLYAHWKLKTFSELYNYKFAKTTGKIYTWNARSSCTNADNSGCNTLDIIKKGEEICITVVKTNKTSYKSVYALVKWASLESPRGATIEHKTLCKDEYNVSNLDSKVYNGKTYYKATVY